MFLSGFVACSAEMADWHTEATGKSYARYLTPSFIDVTALKRTSRLICVSGAALGHHDVASWRRLGIQSVGHVIDGTLFKHILAANILGRFIQQDTVF